MSSFLSPKLMMLSASRKLCFMLPTSPFKYKTIFSQSTRLFSINKTPYPLQYDMIISRPVQSSPCRPPPVRPNASTTPENTGSETEMGFEDWVDRKLASDPEEKLGTPSSSNQEMSKSMRKYYSKRRKRMYGSDSDDERGGSDDGFVELKPEVVDYHRLHKREEDLYFYDTFAYPWEKDKHYKMVYQLEKKYFPDQCLDKAFLDSNVEQNVGKRKKRVGVGEKSDKGVEKGEEDKKLVFFEEEEKKKGERDDGEVRNVSGDVKRDVTEKKVEEFFKCLKKVPNKDAEVGSGEPYLVSRSTELPSRWDGPFGTVVLVNKPKGDLIVVSCCMSCS